LSAGVAHELNNPLTAVQAYAEFLAVRADLEESVREDVEIIYKEAKRATRITANLLAFARGHNGDKRPVSINEVVADSVALHAYRMRVNRVEFVTELEPSLPRVTADYHQLQQVFVNILTNAEQAMAEAHGKGRLEVKTQKAGDTVRISFADDGPGISQENLTNIFDPFFTTKDVGKGTGLGLSICYGIVEEHGGRIRADSVVGQGSTFVVELPIVSEDQAADSQSGLLPAWQ
jgi:two-component system NtrC family sensor kinase